jgi:hypothetical protein
MKFASCSATKRDPSSMRQYHARVRCHGVLRAQRVQSMRAQARQTRKGSADAIRIPSIAWKAV